MKDTGIIRGEPTKENGLIPIELGDGSLVYAHWLPNSEPLVGLAVEVEKSADGSLLAVAKNSHTFNDLLRRSGLQKYAQRASWDVGYAEGEVWNRPTGNKKVSFPDFSLLMVEWDNRPDNVSGFYLHKYVGFYGPSGWEEFNPPIGYNYDRISYGVTDYNGDNLFYFNGYTNSGVFKGTEKLTNSFPLILGNAILAATGQTDDNSFYPPKIQKTYTLYGPLGELAEVSYLSQNASGYGEFFKVGLVGNDLVVFDSNPAWGYDPLTGYITNWQDGVSGSRVFLRSLDGQTIEENFNYSAAGITASGGVPRKYQLDFSLTFRGKPVYCLPSILDRALPRSVLNSPTTEVNYLSWWQGDEETETVFSYNDQLNTLTKKSVFRAGHGDYYGFVGGEVVNTYAVLVGKKVTLSEVSNGQYFRSSGVITATTPENQDVRGLSIAIDWTTRQAVDYDVWAATSLYGVALYSDNGSIFDILFLPTIDHQLKHNLDVSSYHLLGQPALNAKDSPTFLRHSVVWIDDYFYVGHTPQLPTDGGDYEITFERFYLALADSGEFYKLYRDTEVVTKTFDLRGLPNSSGYGVVLWG